MSAPQQPVFNQPAQGKSRIVAGLLNLFLGSLGAGEFFLGYTQYGIYKLVITIAFVVLGFLDLGFISTLIGLLNYVWWGALRAKARRAVQGQGV